MSVGNEFVWQLLKLAIHVAQVIGATNRPDSIDAALRRAGRFDREISLGIPDEAARARILATLSLDLRVGEDVSWTGLARATPGFVGADLKALMSEAEMRSRVGAHQQGDPQHVRGHGSHGRS